MSGAPAAILDHEEVSHVLRMRSNNMEGTGDRHCSVTPAPNYVPLDFVMHSTSSLLRLENLTSDYPFVLTSYPSPSPSCHASFRGFPAPLMLRTCPHLETLHLLFLEPGMLFLCVVPLAPLKHPLFRESGPDHLPHEGPSPKVFCHTILFPFFAAFLMVRVFCFFECLFGIPASSH